MRDGLIHLTLKTEYSFKKVFGKLADLVTEGSGAIGVADINNTFAHVYLEQLCAKNKVKPIFGARIEVFKSTSEKVRNHGPEYIFIAKNYEGLKEINKLIKISYDNFYYKPKIGLVDVWKLSEDVLVIASHFNIQERIDYLGICSTTNKKLLDCDLPHLAIDDNYYPDVESRKMYEILSSPRTILHTYPQHILSYDEFMFHFDDQEAVDNTFKVASECEVKLKKAEMVGYHGDLNLRKLCIEGAKRKGIDLSDKIYSERFEREMALIDEKKFTDYFLITAEMIINAKKKMFVGPSRGSSAGSLVCYLSDITEVDPIKYGLLFERFIDANRHDLPDIDVDFPDNKRESVIKALIEDNGRDRVRRIANVSKLKPKSAIGEFAQAIDIPVYETEEVKDAIIDRSGGDARAAMRIQDTFESTEVGKEFINKYPAMKYVELLENHARHTSVHAAGVIVSNEPLTDYGGVNTRDDTVMLDKKGAEYLNLLKIDCLGLRTLSVLEDCAKISGFSYKEYYDLPLDDEKTFDIFNDGRFHGIFQFEGYSLQSITKGMGVHKFNDIVAITALARPGALHSGGATRYVKHSNGEETPIYYGDIHKSITEESFGIVIYQEQMMNIARLIGNMTWKDVALLRRASSKSLGDEFFSKFKNKFMEGAVNQNKVSLSDAEALWDDICHCGSWIFNKSHAVAYGMISYWTAYAKAHYPLEFTIANLNNSRSDESAVKILRDAVKNEGIEYTALDPDESDIKWTVRDGKLLGGLTSVKGIGVAKARDIMKRRKNNTPLTASIAAKLLNPDSVFNILFPCEYHWGDLYENFSDYNMSSPPSMIENIQDQGDYIFIGLLSDKNLRDLNEYQSVVKRGGTIIENDTLFLNLTFEDDTDSIMTTIDRYAYEGMGREISEKGIVGKDWYLIKGSIKNNWRRVVISHILNLNNHIGLKEFDHAANR